MRIETPEHLNADNDASRIAREREQFLRIAPTLTRAEFEALCVKRPEVWAKYRAEFDKLTSSHGNETLWLTRCVGRFLVDG